MIDVEIYDWLYDEPEAENPLEEEPDNHEPDEEPF